jgi:hypothetical protein
MTEPDRDVIPLPLSRSRATEIVREIAKNSDRWSINVQYEPTQAWRMLVNRRQVELCLLEGYILDDRATLDAYDNWRFKIARVCGGLNVVIEVALQRTQVMPRLFVIAIKGDQI